MSIVALFLLGAFFSLAFPGITQVLAQSLPSPEAISPAPTAHYNLWQAIVLGFIQGLTEFLPISSTAHLKAIPVFLGWGDPGVAFTAIIQLGSIAAVLSYFWSDLAQLVRGTWKALVNKDYKSSDLRIAVGILLGTIPILFFGLLLKKLVPDLDRSPLRSMAAIAIASIGMAILLGLAERFGKRKRGFEGLRTLDGILMGLAQALALIPGVSRSGSTITAGLFLDLERSSAARFSFLLGIPAITLAGLVELKTNVLDVGIKLADIYPLIMGVVSSAFFSYIAIAWLIEYLKRQNTWLFVWYRLAFGLAILSALALKWIPN
ncbi:undecaprenyl-diphosphate phosphatase [Oscillatoria sp. FACHB-1406]|uniref:undecaprenyl-diphosphate phosphatase n=1 Tax=Oscillatoria sp. FACHB-1406 TaxID=2692846 RepID=UPI0018EFFFD3|nr:undecaprenyl-diphosphate phosphatase [Oscillatoria sp. FACHB-1406]